MSESVSSASLSSSERVAVDADAAASHAVVRGEAEAIRLLRVMVECSRGFLSDFEAEGLGTRGGKEAFEFAEGFVVARRRAGRLLQSWALPKGARAYPLRRCTYAQLRECAERHAQGESACAIARAVGIDRSAVEYHLKPSGSMLAAVLDGDLSLLLGERSLPDRQEKAQVRKPVGVARAREKKQAGGVA